MSKLLRIFPLIVAVLVALGPLPFAPLQLEAATLSVSAPADAPSLPVSGPEALLYSLFAFGAIRIADYGKLSEKFAARAGQATKEYEEGVKVAGADWEKGAREGAENYRIGVTQAASDGRFERGVAKAGAAKYTQRAAGLGAQRFGPGVQAAKGDWAKGYQPYGDSLKSLELPAKRPRGQNAARANAVADRLHQMRVSQ